MSSAQAIYDENGIPEPPPSMSKLAQKRKAKQEQLKASEEKTKNIRLDLSAIEMEMQKLNAQEKRQQQRTSAALIPPPPPPPPPAESQPLDQAFFVQQFNQISQTLVCAFCFVG